MTFSNINVSNPNDGLGDKLRDAFIIVNDNFASIGTIVDAAYITATLSNYATKTYVDNIEADLQDQVDFINGRLNTNETDIDALETNVDNLTLSVNGKASLTQLNNSIANVNDSISAQQIQIDGKIDEAPIDGKVYLRRNEEWIDAESVMRPYKVYTALLSQSSNDTPTSIVLENTTGDHIYFEYISTDSFAIRSDVGVFTEDKTIVFYTEYDTKNEPGTTTATFQWWSKDDIRFFGTEGNFRKASLEIRIYN